MSWENIFQPLIVGGVARDHPLTYFDIGARDGFQSDLWPLAFAVDAVGFEPEPEEFQRLDATPDRRWGSTMYLDRGISADGGPQTLHITSDRVGASLLASDPAFGKRFDKPQFFEPDDTVIMQTMTLAEALDASGKRAIDYLKIDIEGAELSVFESAGAVLDETLVIKTEACHLPARRGQGLTRDIDRCLAAQGFELMDVQHAAHWRREGYVVHPFVSARTPAYSRGQFVHADYLYFRTPATIAGDREKLVKVGLLAMAFGFFDHALMLWEDPETDRFLASAYGADARRIVGEAAMVFGRRAFRRAVWAQLKGVAPFLRYLPNALFRG